MQLIEDKGEQQYFIQSYQPGKIVINKVAYDQNLIIGPDILLPNWNLDNLQNLTEELLTPMFAQQPELIIIGTGATTLPLPPSILAFCYQQKIGIEAMTTASACRTLSILFAEKRRVIAGLII